MRSAPGLDTKSGADPLSVLRRRHRSAPGHRSRPRIAVCSTRPTGGTGGPGPPPQGPQTSWHHPRRRSRPSRSRAHRGRSARGFPVTWVVELVGVIGHEDQVCRSVRLAAGPGVAQVDLGRVRAEQVRQDRGCCLQLRIPVIGRLDDLGIEPEGGIVDECPPLTAARSIRRSTPSANASTAPTTSLRSSPRSSAKWCRVPAGTHMYGTLCRAAAEATSAWEPSPPATPIASAPRAMASSASWSRSSPGPQDDRLDAAPLAFLGEVEPLRLAARSSDL
jgi:hypothetical protein